MLIARNLSKSYDAPVLSNFSFHFPEKGLILIRGASGCGKTTLLRILAGLEKPDGGTVETTKPVQISCVFQEPRLVPHLSLLGNLLLVCRKKDKSRAMQYLAALGLEKDAHKAPHQLSGGMKLRTSLARSLYYGGDLYLWDEPTKELDPENRKKIGEILRELSKKACVVVVTHDPELQGDQEILL